MSVYIVDKLGHEGRKEQDTEEEDVMPSTLSLCLKASK